MLRELKTFSALLCVSLYLTTSGSAQQTESAVEVASILSTTVEVENPVMSLDAMVELIGMKETE